LVFGLNSRSTLHTSTPTDRAIIFIRRSNHLYVLARKTEEILREREKERGREREKEKERERERERERESEKMD
jgi:hypothetical protein